MSEQTPNEPSDLVSQLRSRLWNSDVDERLGREAADAIEALRARPTLDREKIADQIMLRVIYQGREGSVITAEDRYDHEYLNALDGADGVLALINDDL